MALIHARLDRAQLHNIIVGLFQEQPVFRRCFSMILGGDNKIYRGESHVGSSTPHGTTGPRMVVAR